MKKYWKPITILCFLVLAIVVAFFLMQSAPKAINANEPIFLPLLISSALVDSVNPCAFSVLIITVAFLASLGLPRRKMLLIGGAYIAGIFAIYLLIGLGLLRVLDVFGVPHFIGKLGAAILLLFGLSNVLSYLFPSFPIEFKLPNFMHGRFAQLIQKASLPATFLLGVLVALFEFPCTGGPYLLILGLLHDSNTYFSGILYLLLYNVIFVAPLAAILFLASDAKLLERANEWKKRAAGKGKLYSGVAMVLLALVIFIFS